MPEMWVVDEDLNNGIGNLLISVISVDVVGASLCEFRPIMNTISG